MTIILCTGHDPSDPSIRLFATPIERAIQRLRYCPIRLSTFDPEVHGFASLPWWQLSWCSISAEAFGVVFIIPHGREKITFTESVLRLLPSTSPSTSTWFIAEQGRDNVRLYACARQLGLKVFSDALRGSPAEPNADQFRATLDFINHCYLSRSPFDR